MIRHHRLALTLKVAGPILTRGDQQTAAGIDAPIARDAEGRAMLPYSLIKGKVLVAMKDLGVAPNLVERWLGEPSGDANGSYDPVRGRLAFGDLTTNQTGKSTDPVIERIEINPETGTAAGQMLAMLESPFAPGEDISFQGTVEFIADDKEAQEIRDKVTAALRWTPSFGSNRTVGFGRTLDVQASLAESPATAAGRPMASSSLAVRWTPDRPLCLVGRKHTGNHFESLDVISGGVFKGCVARLILEREGRSGTTIDPSHPLPGFPTLCRYFEVIRFSEARPMPACASRRPVEPPLSIVVAPQSPEPYYDVALEEGPRLIGGMIPAFVPDWKGKDFAAVRGVFGWESPPRTWRTRTAIDENFGRAQDQQLFSYGLVVPNRSSRPFHWEGSIGLEAIAEEADRAAARAELAALLEFGLPGIGKTRAVAAVEWLDRASDPAVSSSPLPGDIHVLTLQTDALLTHPSELARRTIKDVYGAYWQEASGGALELVRHFARQELQGGHLVRRSGRKPYKPFLVTLRGSTFIVRALDPGKAHQRLASWAETGLPMPSWIGRDRQGTEPLWKVCPFRPDVGFGEVAIDLECHTKRPPAEEVAS